MPACTRLPQKKVSQFPAIATLSAFSHTRRNRGYTKPRPQSPATPTSSSPASMASSLSSLSSIVNQPHYAFCVTIHRRCATFNLNLLASHFRHRYHRPPRPPRRPTTPSLTTSRNFSHQVCDGSSPGLRLFMPQASLAAVEILAE